MRKIPPPEEIILAFTLIAGFLLMLWILISCSSTKGVSTIEYTKGCRIVVKGMKVDSLKEVEESLSLDTCSVGSTHERGKKNPPD